MLGFWVLLFTLCTRHAEVSGVRLCEPFQQTEFAGLSFIFAEVDIFDKGLRLVFFASSLGVDPTDEWGMANMGDIYTNMTSMKLRTRADYSGSRYGKCKVMTPGWDKLRQIARAECQIEWPNDGKTPESFFLRSHRHVKQIRLCPNPKPTLPIPNDRTASVAICVRSFQSTFFGTNDIAIQPHHVTKWLEHHANIGFTRFYLYERIKDDLKNYLEPYYEKNPHHRELVELQYIPYLVNTTRTFNNLVTKAYLFDQMMTLQACYSKARSDGYDLLLHIDFDEYVHTKTPDVPIFETFRSDIDRCPNHHTVTLERCNIRNAGEDPAVTPDDGLWGRNDNNVKTAFNASHMALPKQGHNVHVLMTFKNDACFSDDLYLHHLPDLYTSRSHLTEFRNFLHLDNTTDTEGSPNEKTMIHEELAAVETQTTFLQAAEVIAVLIIAGAIYLRYHGKEKMTRYQT